jgi:pyruvate-ferredoxin/flavodoxin oxidoreductase
MGRPYIAIDGNEAAARVAYALSDVIAIYPITPSSPMGEWADQWAAEGRPNLWGTVPSVTEMQSEGGAAGAIHGALQSGARATTFTASQGLLLMIPNMFKIAGELTPAVFHVSARTIATHALSIFGDHSDVMAARMTGWAMLASGSVQEVLDHALIAHAATLESRIPFVHFFDGFRTSHEVMKIEALEDADLRAMIEERLIHEFRDRALSPEHPVLRGSAQNPDVFFQARESANPYYHACPDIVRKIFDRFGALTGRHYRLFDYVGDPRAEKVIVLMGSGAETVHETVESLSSNGEKVGVVKVRLFRPFVGKALIEALPPSVRTIAVLDRTKEPGAAGEPLYQDVVTALMEHFAEEGGKFTAMPRVVGGRYGLSSKEFTPAMVKGVFDELGRAVPKNHFTVGIRDDVTHTSIEYDAAFSTEPDDGIGAVFYGLGADGTVGANKNSIKIIAEETDFFTQAYFVYDSRKAGSTTVSHLRFGRRPIRSTYLVRKAQFIACHQPVFVERLEMLEAAAEGAVFLLNTSSPPERVWETLPVEVQQILVSRRLRFYVIDAYRLARESGLGGRINTIMQTCFFAISGVLPRDQAVEQIKNAIRKTYRGKGESVVRKNCAAVDETLRHLHEVSLPRELSTTRPRPSVVPQDAPPFVREFTAFMLAGRGDLLPVSAFAPDGTFVTGTAQWEKRNLADEIPAWDPEVCIQCNKCALVCPHAAIRPKVYALEHLAGAPAGFKSTAARGAEFKGLTYTLQTAAEDCTGCGLCVEVCPAKNKRETRLKAINMVPQEPLRDAERENYRFFLEIPEYDRRRLKVGSVKGSQFLLPVFEYSGACSGCGETPYVKLVSQLFGDRALVANATGCSSIYGGNLPTTPWTVDGNGRGPAWSNSLFEDNAEFGLGFRLALDHQADAARGMLRCLAPQLGEPFCATLLDADQSDESGILEQRERVAELKQRLSKMAAPEAKHLLTIADSLVKRSVWIMGGDGWAYDIGYGGLDHVLSTGRNVNVLVLDTEVYSNTGGQMSKATPRAAVAKFAAAGKTTQKKDLGLRAISYGNIYVASVAMGADDNHCVQAFAEAESYEGPSLIIAYSHCIAHGINMRLGMNQQKLAVDSGHWLLYRYDPRRAAAGHNPMQLDSREPKISLKEYVAGENRYQMLVHADPNRAAALLNEAQKAVRRRCAEYARLAVTNGSPPAPAKASPAPQPETATV